MKTFIIVLFILFTAIVVQSGLNISYAQDNCTCAECGYPCKTPMVHSSTCKYKNKRVEESESVNKAEITSETKSFKVADEPLDVEYQMLIYQFYAKKIAADSNSDAQQKEKQMQEIKDMMGKLSPVTEEQKMMYDDIMRVLQK